MKQDNLVLLNNLNRAIIKFRGIYQTWSKEHGISYHEMLVLYTIREFGYCTQKQICDSYLLPKQTIHNVIVNLREKNILKQIGDSNKGREKTFALTEKGQEYAIPFLQSLNMVENQALEQLGKERLQELTDMLWEYDRVLNIAFAESR